MGARAPHNTHLDIVLQVFAANHYFLIYLSVIGLGLSGEEMEFSIVVFVTNHMGLINIVIFDNIFVRLSALTLGSYGNWSPRPH